MPITLTNRAQHLLIVELNDGASIYLAPGRTSNPIDEGRVHGNQKVSKLMRNNLLSADPVNAEGSTAPVEAGETADSEDASATKKSRGRKA